MQNKYVGDIGDFANNGLLRWMSGIRKDIASRGPRQLSLGIVWYLHPDENNKKDGNRTGYLEEKHKSSQALRKCDPPLYDALKKIKHGVEGRERKVSELQKERNGIFPKGTKYYGDRLFYTRTERRPSRPLEEESWLEGAIKATKGVDIVFVNPDKGIASKKKEKEYIFSQQHVYMKELELFAGKHQCLIIYNHLQRNKKKHKDDVKALSRRLGCKLTHTRIWALYFGGEATYRAYFIVAQTEEQKSIIEKRLASFLAGPWGNYFKLVS